MKETVEQILDKLEEGANPAYLAKMAHFGIGASKALGWRTPALKELAKPYRKNQALAMALYRQPHHEAKLLTAFIGDAKQISLSEADTLTEGFYSWDLVDQCCSNLLAKASFAMQLPARYLPDNREYVRRTGFVMVAQIAQKHKTCNDEDLLQFLPLMAQYAYDERNFVKKAHSWALRTLGKRSLYLNGQIQGFCKELLKQNSKAAQWSARDTLREITQEKYLQRLKR